MKNIIINSTIREEPWFQNPLVAYLYLYLNCHCDNSGEIIASRSTLSRKTGLTEREIRTGVKHLTDAGQLESNSTNKATTIKLCHYKDTSKAETSKRPDNDQPKSFKIEFENERYTVTEHYYKEFNEHQDKMYRKIIAVIFGDNLSGKPLEWLLKMEGQLTWETWSKIVKRYNLEYRRSTIAMLANKVETINEYQLNSKGKKYKSFYLTLNRWIGMQMNR
jgi:hypothetical protein